MPSPRILFTLRWSLVSLLGASLGSALGWLGLNLYLAYASDRGAIELLSILFLMPVIGLGYGLGQALLLGRYLPRMGWWVVATMVGWLLSLSVQFYLSNVGMSGAWVGFALAGLYLGAFQWLVLYYFGFKRRFIGSAVWIPLMLVAWLIGGELINLANEPLQTLTHQALGGAAASVLTWALAGLITGLITGPGMAVFLERVSLRKESL